MVKLSVVILTKNEEACIAECLESVKWADEIIVVDDESTDKTVEIVKKCVAAAKVFHRKMDVAVSYTHLTLPTILRV